MNRQNVVHPYTEILFVNKKEQGTCHKVGEPPDHHGKWKTLVTKSHLLFLCEISRTQANPKTRNRLVAAKGVTANRGKGFFLGDEMYN